MTPQVLDSNQARTKWREIIDAVMGGLSSVVIERYGKPVVAVIPYADFEALQEKIEDLRAERHAEATFQAWTRNPSLGRPWKEVKAELIEEGLLT